MGVEQSKEKFRKAIPTEDLDRLETRIIFDPTLVSEADMQRIHVAASKSVSIPKKLRLAESVRKHYKFVEELGGGAFSKVYGCYDRNTGVKYACKAIKVAVDQDTLPEGAAPLDNVMAEIELISTLSHPNIVGLRECFVDGADVYLIMEVLAGGTLLDELMELDSYREHEAKLVFRQILSALSYMHSRNAVHCDIKLENIMLGSKGNLEDVKLIDLGLAIKTNANGIPEEEQKLMKGTPLYMAPEVIAGRSDAYQPSSDIWSCGVLLHMLLTGEPPFMADSPEELLEVVDRENGFHPKSSGEISKEAVDLLSKLLVVNPKDRLTASQALDHIWLREDSMIRKMTSNLSMALSRLRESLSSHEMY